MSGVGGYSKRSGKIPIIDYKTILKVPEKVEVASKGGAIGLELFLKNHALLPTRFI